MRVILNCSTMYSILMGTLLLVACPPAIAQTPQSSATELNLAGEFAPLSQIILSEHTGSPPYLGECDQVEIDCDGTSTLPSQCVLSFPPDSCELIDISDGEKLNPNAPIEPRIKFKKAKEVSTFCGFRAGVVSIGYSDFCLSKRILARDTLRCLGRYNDSLCSSQQLPSAECRTLSSMECSAEQILSFTKCGCGKEPSTCLDCVNSCAEGRSACRSDKGLDPDNNDQTICEQIGGNICIAIASE